MKNLALIFFVLSGFLASSQSVKSIKLKNWMDVSAYVESANPAFKVFGPYSEDLAKINSGREYLYANDMYFEVNNVADYYLWYTQYNPEKFNFSVSHYVDFYIKKDVKNMMLFVQEGFVGDELPIAFKKVNANSTHMVGSQRFSSVSDSYNGLRVNGMENLSLDLAGSSFRFQGLNRPPVVPSSK